MARVDRLARLDAVEVPSKLSRNGALELVLQFDEVDVELVDGKTGGCLAMALIEVARTPMDGCCLRLLAIVTPPSLGVRPVEAEVVVRTLLSERSRLC